jgi:cysteine desulfurase
MDKACVYLDYAATTPVDPRVAQEMAGCLTVDGVFANPASVHAHGRRAAEWVEQARGQVAALIKAEPAEILWTGGATEANNLAILGAARFYGRRGRHILSVATEHKSVLGPLAALAREGFQIEYLPTDEQGRVAPAGLAAALRSDTVLVSIMHVNNETGTVQDLAALAVVLAKSQALFHVDAVQSAGRLALDLGTLPVDLLSLSAHKLYGPKGVGALYVRRRPRVRLAPVLFGGEQEQGARPGTVPVHQVVGMGAAYRLAAEQGARDSAHARTLLGRLWAGLEPLGGILRNGSAEAPHILNLSFVGVHGEALAAELPRLSVATGSACTAASGSPSHVLRALGRPDALAHASLRFSGGSYRTEQDIDSAVEMIRSALLRLRALSPVWRAYREGAPLATLYKEAST